MEKNRMLDQATINIGTIGHVAHGKSTVVQCISGKSTIRYKKELERNITIKLGYANAKIYECECPRPGKYSVDEGLCIKCNSEKKLIRHVSFVDCPGHDVLMTTMLNGTAIMDAALLLIAGNESCPQPQTIEHLFAIEIMNLKKIVVVQNKIDLVSKDQAMGQYEQIKEFLKTSNVNGPIVPVSAQFGVNIDAILDFIVNYIEVPKRNEDKDPKMIIIRSFDINKPGTKIEDIKGGVMGGSLVTGILRIGDEIEIRPGIVSRKEGRFECRPFVTRIVNLKTEKKDLKEAVPGGLIGVETDLDPSFSKSDWLVGMVMGIKGKLPPIHHCIRVSYTLFQKTLTQRKEDLHIDEQILLNIGSTTTGCRLVDLEKNLVSFSLFKPCCCEIGERIAISRKVRNNWRLIGYGVILSGEKTPIEY